MNKIREVIYPNSQVRTLIFNKEFIPKKEYVYDMLILEHNSKHSMKPAITDSRVLKAIELYDKLLAINLVTSISITSYEVSIKIQDGFDDDYDEWERIMLEATQLIQEYVFHNEESHFKVLDRRSGYASYSESALDHDDSGDEEDNEMEFDDGSSSDSYEYVDSGDEDDHSIADKIIENEREEREIQEERGIIISTIHPLL